MNDALEMGEWSSPLHTITSKPKPFSVILKNPVNPDSEPNVSVKFQI